MVHLKYLNLNQNQLQTLPSTIGQLVYLESLNVSKNKLECLLNQISNLINLQILDASCNKLKTLPNGIGCLKKLKELHLYNNAISTLPTEIAALSNLEIIRLFDNELITLPSQLWQLVNLRSLLLDGNRLKYIPDEISQLKHLRNLGLSGNQLESLPFTLTELHVRLNVEDNPFTQMPILRELKGYEIHEYLCQQQGYGLFGTEWRISEELSEPLHRYLSHFASFASHVYHKKVYLSAEPGPSQGMVKLISSGDAEVDLNTINTMLLHYMSLLSGEHQLEYFSDYEKKKELVDEIGFFRYTVDLLLLTSKKAGKPIDQLLIRGKFFNKDKPAYDSRNDNLSAQHTEEETESGFVISIKLAHSLDLSPVITINTSWK